MRLEASLADALDRYSEATNIPKTTISRIALTKFLNELENSGARAVLQQVCKLWNAILNYSFLNNFFAIHLHINN